MDADLAHISYEAGILEGRDHTPKPDMWLKTADPLKAPEQPIDITIYLEKGIPAKIESPQSPATGSFELFTLLKRIASEHGVDASISWRTASSGPRAAAATSRPP